MRPKEKQDAGRRVAVKLAPGNLAAEAGIRSVGPPSARLARTLAPTAGWPALSGTAAAPESAVASKGWSSEGSKVIIGNQEGGTAGLHGAPRTDAGGS